MFLKLKVCGFINIGIACVVVFSGLCFLCLISELLIKVRLVMLYSNINLFIVLLIIICVLVEGIFFEECVI